MAVFNSKKFIFIYYEEILQSIMVITIALTVSIHLEQKNKFVNAYKNRMRMSVKAMTIVIEKCQRTVKIY